MENLFSQNALSLSKLTCPVVASCYVTDVLSCFCSSCNVYRVVYIVYRIEGFWWRQDAKK